ERRGDLPKEDREREVPRRDADEYAAPAPDEHIALAGRTGHHRFGEEAPGLGGIVAAEIDGLANLGDAFDQRLAALRGEDRYEAVAFGFEEVGEPFQGRGAFCGGLA